MGLLRQRCLITGQSTIPRRYNNRKILHFSSCAEQGPPTSLPTPCTQEDQIQAQPVIFLPTCQETSPVPITHLMPPPSSIPIPSPPSLELSPGFLCLSHSHTPPLDRVAIKAGQPQHPTLLFLKLLPGGFNKIDRFRDQFSILEVFFFLIIIILFYSTHQCAQKSGWRWG